MRSENVPRSFRGILLLSDRGLAYVDGISCRDDILQSSSFADVVLPPQIPSSVNTYLADAFPEPNRAARIEVAVTGRVKEGRSGFFENRECSLEMSEIQSLRKCEGAEIKFQTDVPSVAYPWYNRSAQAWEKHQVAELKRSTRETWEGLLLVRGNEARIALGASCGQKSLEHQLLLRMSLARSNQEGDLKGMFEPPADGAAPMTRSAEVQVVGELDDDDFEQRLAGVMKVKSAKLVKRCGE